MYFFSSLCTHDSVYIIPNEQLFDFHCLGIIAINLILSVLTVICTRRADERGHNPIQNSASSSTNTPLITIICYFRKINII